MPFKILTIYYLFIVQGDETDNVTRLHGINFSRAANALALAIVDV